MKQSLPSLIAQGNALLELDLPEAVETLVRPHLADSTGPLPLWKLLATACRRQARFEEALRIQDMIAETSPGDMVARYDLADTLLTLGAFERGWREYRFRYRMPHTQSRARHVQGPRWEGAAIPGKTLLIHDEQGFGDTFQFIRLIRRARETSDAARIIVEVVPEVYPLIKRSFPDFTVTRRGEIPPTFDMHCELMSLPLAVDLRLDDLPGSTPYLMHDPERLAYWEKRLSGLPRPLVALVWAGRPEHPNDANRSLPLSLMQPLAGVPAHFISIQKGPAADQTAPAGLEITRLSSEIRDFEDTAAILTLADRLISVDSSPVHLAGALGLPAWVLLPFSAEWRWLTHRMDSPWYPTHRLFRQEYRGGWRALLERVASELAEQYA